MSSPSPAFFAEAETGGKLPADRAEWCGDEYRAAAYAVHALISPSVDAVKASELKARHRARWDVPGGRATGGSTSGN